MTPIEDYNAPNNSSAIEKENQLEKESLVDFLKKYQAQKVFQNMRSF